MPTIIIFISRHGMLSSYMMVFLILSLGFCLTTQVVCVTGSKPTWSGVLLEDFPFIPLH